MPRQRKSKWTAEKIIKQFKLTCSIPDVHPKLYSFIEALINEEFTAEDDPLDHAAREIANIAMGKHDWHGKMHEQRHFSGLSKLANKYMAEGWKLTEIANGDGYSTYLLAKTGSQKALSMSKRQAKSSA